MRWMFGSNRPTVLGLDRLSSADLLITLGGDGTLLRAARMGAPYNAPMLGVKMGKLGFLAEIHPDNWMESLHQVLDGQYWFEERLMVRACVERPNGDGMRRIICEFDALNDVVVSRGDLARVVRISAHLDGEYLTTYSCDGVIVSTATGSTGYALAVGGPILPPELRHILVIPIVLLNSFGWGCRSMVKTIRIRMRHRSWKRSVQIMVQRKWP